MTCSLCIEETNKLCKTNEGVFIKDNVIHLIKTYLNLILDEYASICIECCKQLESWHHFNVKICRNQYIYKNNEMKTLNNLIKSKEESDHNGIELKSNMNTNDNKDSETTLHQNNQNEQPKKTPPEVVGSTYRRDLHQRPRIAITETDLKNKTKQKHHSDLNPLQQQTECITNNPISNMAVEKNTSILFEAVKSLEPANIIKNNDIEDEIDKKLNQYMAYKCSLCNDELPSFKKLIRHIFNIHKRRGYAVCCNIKLFNRTLAVEHIDRYHSKTQILHKCPECGKSFHNIKSLNNHRVIKHNVNKQTLFPCILCDSVSFSRNDQLKKHQRDKHTEKQCYKCSKCTKIFQNNGKLRDHFTRVHSLSLPEHICDICGLSFKTKCGFKNHHKEVHLGIVKPKQKCDICGNLVKHLQKHKYMTHPADNIIIKCEICDKKLSTWNALYNHKQHAHRKKKFICEICKKAFKELKLLKEHIATHTGQPLYQCAYCSTTFKSEANYFKHRKRVHEEEMKNDKRGKINLN